MNNLLRSRCQVRRDLISDRREHLERDSSISQARDESRENGHNHLERYERIRKTSRRLTSQMMQHVPKHALTRTSKELNLMHRGVIVFDSEEDTNFLMDRCFYDIQWRGKTLIEHFIDSDDYTELTEEQKAIVQGMTTAYYSLFEILRVNPSNSTMDVDDLLGDRTYRLTDLNLSRTAREGYLLATRIVKQGEGIYLMTGATCPFSGEQRQVLLDGIKPRKTLLRRGKNRRQTRKLQRSDYSAHFFKEYKRIGEIEFSTKDV